MQTTNTTTYDDEHYFPAKIPLKILPPLDVSKVNIHYYKYEPKQDEINKDVYFLNNENKMVKGNLTHFLI